MSTARAIGSTITLITNSQIRYEGTLGHIDAAKNTVSLSNVRVFGTEGRAKEPGQVEVPANDQLFEQIVFRGSDIKELTVFEGGHNAMMDPAVVTAFPARSNTTKTATTPQRFAPSSGNANHQQQQHQQQQHHHQQQRYGGSGVSYRRGGHNGGGRGGYRGTRRVDSHTGQDFR
ncbi:putative kinesin, partial [Trypanosoma grayi]|uniref:putative kinesin n=1 Tax=Trypanosoma grayi TaxID=71804 RepID=UPI0004F43DE7